MNTESIYQHLLAYKQTPEQLKEAFAEGWRKAQAVEVKCIYPANTPERQAWQEGYDAYINFDELPFETTTA